MSKHYRRHYRRRVASWWCHIPRPVWVLLEVLVVILAAHMTHVSPNNLLPLFKLFTAM